MWAGMGLVRMVGKQSRYPKQLTANPKPCYHQNIRAIGATMPRKHTLTETAALRLRTASKPLPQNVLDLAGTKVAVKVVSFCERIVPASVRACKQIFWAVMMWALLTVCPACRARYKSALLSLRLSVDGRSLATVSKTQNPRRERQSSPRRRA